ncbi:MAG: NAD(P)-dependent oxidoreductase [Eubacterium sp.]|nr:NAD(P)-dependent oxidoreductase [Eubacterium sp.]
MKITVLGANSYIARNLIFLLYKKISEGKDLQLYLYDLQGVQADGRKEYEQVDILDATAVKKVHFDVDIIYMFIGKTGTVDGFWNYQTFIEINEVALLHVLAEYVRRKSNAKIMYPSTRLVYNGSDNKIYEDGKKQFLTVYAMNKYACEQYLEMYSRMFGVKYCILRICVPYGTMVPGAYSYGTAEFMLKKAENGEDITIYGEGAARRSIIHIEDLCETLVRSAFSSACFNDAYNVGGEDYSLLEMAKQVAGKYSVGVVHVQWPDEALKIETGSTVFASDKLDEVIQYESRHTFREWILVGSF